MESIGVRELKAGLSRHLKRVQAGARLIVTERGRAIATLSPIEAPEADWIDPLLAAGRARWNGGKPAGARRAAVVTRSVSSAVLEDRR
jgi:antitoxin (DNA-binding transcriptional repressor) of toxin-antitoxin stability system